MKEKADLAYLKDLANKLAAEKNLTDEEFMVLLTSKEARLNEILAADARILREKYYGRKVYIRGLIEFTGYCKNDCRYCGLRRSNAKARRYRLTAEEIIACCHIGYALGFRTFVLQGGEDNYFSDDIMTDIVRRIKEDHPDAAVTLSLGERERESYEKLKAAGAERYLLRHETAVKAHYDLLHPPEMSYEHRMTCLKHLRELGYRVGCGMMIGSPGQRPEFLLADLRFLQRFRPEMVGLGPFIPHGDTPYAKERPGSLTLTLRLISLVRLILPKALIPATTALATIHPAGRSQGLLAGANVIMPNLSPPTVRDKYLLYDNKASWGAESAEHLATLAAELKNIGYRLTMSRGDPAQ